MVNFGEIIKKRRKELQISQVQLAKLLNCSRYYVSRLEGNKLDVPLSQLYKLSVILDTSIMDLLALDIQFCNRYFSDPDAWHILRIRSQSSQEQRKLMMWVISKLFA